jgi:hypothetical protein
MSVENAGAGRDGANRTAIVVAVITGICVVVATIGAAVIESRRSDREPIATVEQQGLHYVGIVTTEEGKPIPNATVLAVVDQNVGQTIRTDGSGQFQLQVAADIHSLRLKVDATGFGEERIEANVHRTGPEEIYLHRLHPAQRRP